MMIREIRTALKNMKLPNKLFISFSSLGILPLIIISILYYNIAAASLRENTQTFTNLFISQLISQTEES